MAPASISHSVFPSLYSSTRLNSGAQLYDVKFYPFPTTKDEQVFAVCGMKDIFVCRLDPKADPPYQILRWWKDDDSSSQYNSVVWTKDPTSQKPLLCVAGATPKQIQIYDVESGRHLRSLTGHGRGINDLAISPLDQNLIFSAAEDYEIRIWNLKPQYEKQPCVAIFAGEGHRQPILAIALHPNGKWMLSGGLDTAVCLWAIPEPEDLARDDDRSDVSPKPEVVYYPYFHSTEVHHNYVDSVAFYGDLIISRACRSDATQIKNEILLWKIDGFDPGDPPPDEPPIPSDGIKTRSGFAHSQRSRGFQRLLTFEMNNTDRFYQRFCLLDHPQMRPLLVMGNLVSKFCFWDLQRLEEGLIAGEKGFKSKASRKSKSSAKPESSFHEQFRVDELRNSVASQSVIGTSTTTSSRSPSPAVERRYQLDRPFEPLRPHHTQTVATSLTKEWFGTSAISFSPDGTWMIGVGDRGMMNIFHRDSSAVG